MLDTVDTTKPSPGPTFPPTLADLSRNASVISSSSDSETTTTTVLKTPRPRPTRTFSSPRSRSPQSPTLQAVRPPAYLTRELGVSEEAENRDTVPEPLSVQRSSQARSKSRKPSRSRNPSANTRLSAQDFVFGETLGEGSYSTVMGARHARTGQEYAIKILDKNHLIRKEKMLVALAEKNTLVKLGVGHPGIIHLHWTFQDEWSLFFVLDLAPNGEMQTRISRMGSLSLSCARYYTAQIVDAIEYMHDKDVIHRDLKPENILFDGEFRIKVTDFGTGKILEPGQERANSFVGTAQYVSPELLERNETSRSSDLWSLGCIVYQMIAGRFAFQGLSEYLTWQKIKSLDYSFPEGFDEDAKDFVSKLLVRDPLRRLSASRTSSSPSSLRAHPFLASINWETLWTDPPPTLEPGLIKKEPPQQGGGLWDVEDGDARWEDVGAKWDALVVADDDGEEMRGGTVVNGSQSPLAQAVAGASPSAVGHDGMEWAEDAHGPEFERHKLTDASTQKQASRVGEDVGPMGESADYTQAATDSTQDTKTDVGPTNANVTNEVTKTAMEMDKENKSLDIAIPQTSTLPSTSIPIHIPSTPSNMPGSGSSSSDGSVEKSGIASAIAALELGRGRNRALTPVQGNGTLRELDLSSLLLSGEKVIFNTRVEARSPKRRGSRLRLPISVSPIRPKTRQLLLTTHRLLCVKQRVEGGVSLKSELSLRKGVGAVGGEKEKVKEKEKEKEKEAKSIVESAERKGEREFVVLTSTKSQTYAAETGAIATQWVEKINTSLMPLPSR